MTSLYFLVNLLLLLFCLILIEATYYMLGSQDGKVHAWSVKYGNRVAVLEGNHPGPTYCVDFNPKSMMLASACTNVGFWLPTVEES
eukprot:m.9454 g.9454  ORF g.9454 m.9454 type:complete len:86 (+) comp21365_c0_seq2:50-307(+)